jgi:hypothetical protein
MKEFLHTMLPILHAVIDTPDPVVIEVTSDEPSPSYLWYQSLSRKQKASFRESFHLATGVQLMTAMRLFSFQECIDLLYNKLQREGFQL